MSLIFVHLYLLRLENALVLNIIEASFQSQDSLLELKFEDQA